MGEQKRHKGIHVGVFLGTIIIIVIALAWGIGAPVYGSGRGEARSPEYVTPALNR